MGYIKDPETKKLAVDDEAAAIVRRIFAMCASGNGPSQIARILKKEQVLTPTMYAYTRYGMNHTCLVTCFYDDPLLCNFQHVHFRLLHFHLFYMNGRI